MKKEWYHIDPDLVPDTPALLVFPDRVKENIAEAIRVAGSAARLRPHIKTCKSEGPVRLMQAAGITKFKCATIAEAELLAQCNAPDVLLAYQPQGPKAVRLLQLVKTYRATAFSCLVDNMKVAIELNELFENAGEKIAAYLDLNIGMNRTGVAPGAHAADIYSFINDAPALEAMGLHAYDGHIRAKERGVLQRECDASYELVIQMQNLLSARGMSGIKIIAGGSVTFPVHAARENIECSPGTFVYWDHGYMQTCADQAFKPAAVIITRVISAPATNVIATDLGHKSVAAENELPRRVFFPAYPSLQPIGQSEEHLVLQSGEDAPVVGDVLYGIPWHVCPTVALYERVLTVEDGNITGEWLNRARDRKINI